jgi:hypothetical protein
LPNKWINAGLQITSSGFTAYRNSAISLVTAKRLGEAMSVGIRFNYQALKIAGYGKARAITADAGLLCHLSPNLHFGLQINNPTGSQDGNGVHVPAIYSCGLGYEPSGTLLFSVQVVKQQSQPAAARLGMQYRIHPMIIVRTMIQSSDPSFWFGAGFQRARYRLDVYSNYHLQLGMGMGMVLYWHFEKKNQGVAE